jgi:murein DD-endopeptidase MepM/ murein hydrolase activator NlpD
MKFMQGLLPPAQCPVRRRSNLAARGSALALSVALVAAATPAGALEPLGESKAGVSTSSSTTSAASSTGYPLVASPEKVRRFWVKDKHFYFSKWYAGRHRKMINFGCTRAPYYDPSPLCRHRRGFHHGVDIAMKCGTRLFAGLRGTVVRPGAPGSLGSAYGPYAFRLRNHRRQIDVVIGHVKRVYVQPGDHVAKGTLMARASDQGAPDGCHLHFEVRPRGASFDDAVNPMRYLDLRRHRAR